MAVRIRHYRLNLKSRNLLSVFSGVEEFESKVLAGWTSQLSLDVCLLFLSSHCLPSVPLSKFFPLPETGHVGLEFAAMHLFVCLFFMFL